MYKVKIYGEQKYEINEYENYCTIRIADGVGFIQINKNDIESIIKALKEAKYGED